MYPYERTDEVLGYQLHFTQLPIREKGKQDTGISKSFHTTICFDTEFKNISKGDARSTCFKYLNKMNILLSMDYSSPIDIGLNQITKNWADFLKLHLKHMLKDGLVLLRGEHAFLMELEGGEWVIGKLKRASSCSQMCKTFGSTSKVTHYVTTLHIASSTH